MSLLLNPSLFGTIFFGQAGVGCRIFSIFERKSAYVMVPYNIQSLLQKLLVMAQRWSDTGVIPPIERDIALEKIRRIYDELLSGSTDSGAAPVDSLMEEPISINLDEVLSVELPVPENADHVSIGYSGLSEEQSDVRPEPVSKDATALAASEPMSGIEPATETVSGMSNGCASVRMPDAEPEPEEERKPVLGVASEPEPATGSEADSLSVSELTPSGQDKMSEPQMPVEKGMASVRPQPAAHGKEESRSAIPSLFGPEETEALRRHRQKQRILMSLYDMPEPESRKKTETARHTPDKGTVSYPALRAEANQQSETLAAEVGALAATEEEHAEPLGGSGASSAVGIPAVSGAEPDARSASDAAAGSQTALLTEEPKSASELVADEPTMEEIEFIPKAAQSEISTIKDLSSETEQHALSVDKLQEETQRRNAEPIAPPDRGSSGSASASYEFSAPKEEPDTTAAFPDEACTVGAEKGKTAEAAYRMMSSRPENDGSTRESVLGDVINHDVRTLGDKLGATVRGRVSETTRREPVTDLRRSIGINDKFLLIRDLFDGDSEAYEAAIATLDAFDDFDDCLVHIAEHYAWNPNSDGAKLLMELIERKLS